MATETNPYVSGILKILATYNVAFPIAAEAIIGIIGLFRSLNPGVPLPTDEEAIALLKAHATASRDAENAWLASKGFS